MRVDEAILAAMALAICAPTIASAQAIRSIPAGGAYEVFDHRKLVLTFEARPGVITSTALPGAGSAPVRSAIISGSARAPEAEDRLRTILDHSVDARDFIDRLRRAGFVVVRSAPPDAR